MNGYVEAGYVVVLGTLGTYSVTLLARERAARRRIGGTSTTWATNSPDTAAGTAAEPAGAAGTTADPAGTTADPAGTAAEPAGVEVEESRTGTST